MREVARYQDLRIETPDRSVLNLRISGNFRSDDIDTLLLALPKVLSIDIAPQAPNTLRITRRLRN